MAYIPEEEIRVPKALRIFGLIVKAVFVLAVVVMMGWLALRGCYQEGTGKVKRYLFTETATALYETDGLTIQKLTAYNDNTLGRAFYIGHVTYTEELGQFQFMLRYNRHNETVKTHIEENGLHSFAFILVDNLGNRYTDYCYVTDEALMYGYYRLVFDGVDTAPITGLNVYIYEAGEEIDFDDRIESCAVWYSDGPTEEYKLSSVEKRAARPSVLADVNIKLKASSDTEAGDETTGEE